MRCMTSKRQNHYPEPGSNNGFVVAMRAKLIGPVRRLPYEWMIVSRWGKHGENLSIGWTMLPALCGDAPIGLTPRQSAFAVRQERSSGWTPATFRLTPVLHPNITMAGDFIPAEGYVRLYGSGPTLRVRSEARCLRPDLHPGWHVEAERAVWIGEYIELQPPTEAPAPASAQPPEARSASDLKRPLRQFVRPCSADQP